MKWYQVRLFFAWLVVVSACLTIGWFIGFMIIKDDETMIVGITLVSFFVIAWAIITVVDSFKSK